MSRERLVAPSVSCSRSLREACEATEYNEYAGVNAVTVALTTSLGFEDDRRRIEVYRFRARAPGLSPYEDGGRTFRVTRMTRPLRERLG